MRRPMIEGACTSAPTCPLTGGVHNAPANGRAPWARRPSRSSPATRCSGRCRPLRRRRGRRLPGGAGGSGVRVVLSHGSYLVNLASPVPDFLDKSRDAASRPRCARCHAPGHPLRRRSTPARTWGAARSAGLDARRAQPRPRPAARREGLDVMPLLEVTAGQGTCLGHRFEQLARGPRPREASRSGVGRLPRHLPPVRRGLRHRHRRAATRRRMRAFDRIVGLQQAEGRPPERLQVASRGSRVDRHARAGEGMLGLETFRRILNDRALRGHPAGGGDAGPARRMEEGDRAAARPRARPARRAGAEAARMTPAACAGRARQGPGPRGRVRPRRRGLARTRRPSWPSSRSGSRRGHAGEMAYLTGSRTRRVATCATAFPWARSVIAVGLQYDTPAPYSTEADARTAAGSRATPGATTTTTS